MRRSLTNLRSQAEPGNEWCVFNLAGQVIQDIDAKNAITSSTYDARGRRISTTDRINAATTFTFDAAGNELSMTDAENQTTSYSYDALNRRLTIQWPDHVAGTVPGDQHYGIQHTAYDAAGRALRKTDQRGDTITLIYDLAGRMLRREYRTLANSTPLEDGLPTGPVADQDVFTYDAASRMLTATKGRYSNTVTFTYDTGGRRASETLSRMGSQPVSSYTVAYAYDSAGRESQLTYPDGTVVQRAFTPRSQLQSVSLTEPGSNTALTVSTFEYDAGRRETSRTYGNGITTTRTYRADNLVTTITAPAVESLAYTYDVNKNPTSELRSGVMAPYSWATGESGFDAQNRLTNWTRQNGDSQSWQLTAVNDWQSFTNNGVQQQRTHGPTHEILSIDNTPLVHDSRGNLTQDNRGTSMTYDADNMLSVFGANAVEGLRNATYTYDALGRRVSKTVAGATANDPSTTTLFILANQQVIAEYQSIGSQQPILASRTAYGTYIDEPLILLSNLQSQIAYYHANRQYSVYTLSDAAGFVLDRIAYAPYGEHYCFTATGAARSQIPEAGNAVLFTSRTGDAESGLHYFRARYFAPKLGRFLSHDPILYPDGRNTFTAWFAPSYTDPRGTDVFNPYTWTFDTARAQIELQRDQWRAAGNTLAADLLDRLLNPPNCGTQNLDQHCPKMWSNSVIQTFLDTFAFDGGFCMKKTMSVNAKGRLGTLGYAGLLFDFIDGEWDMYDDFAYATGDFSYQAAARCTQGNDPFTPCCCRRICVIDIQIDDKFTWHSEGPRTLDRTYSAGQFLTRNCGYGGTVRGVKWSMNCQKTILRKKCAFPVYITQ